MGGQSSKPAASSRKRLSTRDLACTTALADKLNSSATARRRPAFQGEGSKCLPRAGLEIRPDDGKQLLENVLVVVLVPLPGQVAIGIRQLRQEIIGLVAKASAWLLCPRFAKGPDAIDRYLSQPGTKGTIAAALERRQLTEKDDEDFLTQVLDLLRRVQEPAPASGESAAGRCPGACATRRRPAWQSGGGQAGQGRLCS